MDNMFTEDVQGFGESTMAELAELRKALEIGYSQPTTGVGFDALRVESLEQTLKILTYMTTHIRLWNQMPKQDAFSTVEEYNRLVEYGADGGGFVPSGELPEEEDTVYERADQKVKYMGTTRSVHHPATLVRTVPADLIAQETQNGAMWLMGKINSGLYYADSDVRPLDWNSVPKQIEDGAGNVYDLKGQPLQSADIENMAQLIIDNYGTPSRMYSNPKVFTDFSKLWHQYQRFPAPSGAAGVIGTPATGFNTLSGRISFEGDLFVRRGSTPPASAANSKVPQAPTVAAGSATGSGSDYEAGDAGNYQFTVTAVNRFGESLPATQTGNVAVTAGQRVPLTITDGGGAYPATGYKLYRTDVNGTTVAYTNKQIPRSKTGGVYDSDTVYNEGNEWRPGTFIGMLLDMTNQSLMFKQLSPMIKMNLAMISPAIRWMQLLYGTPIVYAPKKNVLIKNIGVASP